MSKEYQTFKIQGTYAGTNIPVGKAVTNCEGCADGCMLGATVGKPKIIKMGNTSNTATVSLLTYYCVPVGLALGTSEGCADGCMLGATVGNPNI